MKTFDEAILEVFHQPGLGHGKDCYCEALQIFFKEHREVAQILLNDPIVKEAILLSNYLPLSMIIPALSLTMIEIGVRVGLRMSTPILSEDLLK